MITILNTMLIVMYYTTTSPATLYFCIFVMSWLLGLKAIVDVLQAYILKTALKMESPKITEKERDHMVLKLSLKFFADVTAIPHKLYLFSTVALCALCIHLGCYWASGFIIISIISRYFAFGFAVDNIEILKNNVTWKKE